MVAQNNSSQSSTTNVSTSSPSNYSTAPPPTLKMPLPPYLLHPIESWTKLDVQKFIHYCIEEYSLGDVNLSDFEMNGKALLLLTEESFKQRCPRSGDVLHKALQQHMRDMKSLSCQAYQHYQYQLWNNFNHLLPLGSASPPTPNNMVATARRFGPPNFHPQHPSTPVNLHPNPMHPAFHFLVSRLAAEAALQQQQQQQQDHLHSRSPAHPLANSLNRSSFLSQPPPVQPILPLAPPSLSTNHFTIPTEPPLTSPSSAATAARRQLRQESSETSNLRSVPQNLSTSGRTHVSNHHPTSKHSAHDILEIKRESSSPLLLPPNNHTRRQTTPSPPESVLVVKRECASNSPPSAPTPPITSSSPSLSLSSNSSTTLHIDTMGSSASPSKMASLKACEEFDEEAGEEDDKTRQVRYYNDRIDFRGDVLFKPPAAKNCRILWEFLYILLEDPQYESIVHWEHREKMIFRIIQADKLAALWGLQKNRLSMTYEKLSRGMRYYYSNNIISKEQSKRLLYRFMRSPEEIRKSMKRNGGTATMVYSTPKKQPQERRPSCPNEDSHDESEVELTPSELLESASLGYPRRPPLNQQQQLPATPTASTAQMHHILRLLSSIQSSQVPPISVPPPPSLCTLNPSQFFNNSSRFSQPSPAKSDRSSSSSPDSSSSSYDSRNVSDHEPTNAGPTSAALTSGTTTSKRKQAVPLRHSSSVVVHHSEQQPLNLAVPHKEEQLEADEMEELLRKKIRANSPISP